MPLVPGVRQIWRVWLLRGIQLLDRWRLRRLARRHPGVAVDPAASTNLAVARYRLAPGARLVIGPGVAADRRAGALHFSLETGAFVEIRAGTWLRTEIEPVQVIAYAGAHVTVGPDGLLNGCLLSAKRRIEIGRRVLIGLGSRVFDADQHDLDADRPERAEPVRIGDHVWIAADATVLRGVAIGDHGVVGSRSLVTRDVPPHTFVAGAPAREVGKVGDRSRAR